MIARTFVIPSSALTTLPLGPSQRCGTCGFPKVYHTDGKLGHPFVAKATK